MNKEQLGPVAAHLNVAYADTADYSRKFKDDHHDMPPSVMAKAHHMRSVAQALIGNDERYRLSPQYTEFGRVLFKDLESSIDLLLRSSGAQRIETLQTTGQLALGIKLDPVFVQSRVRLVVYEFGIDGVHLSIVGTKRPRKGTRLVASGTPVFVGTWAPVLADDEPFDQAAREAFDEVGDIGFDEGEDAGE